MTLELAVCVGCLALLAGSGVVALVLIAFAQRAMAVEMRRLHAQQANIVRMLLKAGFRPARGRDWFDTGLGTLVKGEGSPFDTKLDLRRPQEHR